MSGLSLISFAPFQLQSIYPSLLILPKASTTKLRQNGCYQRHRVRIPHPKSHRIKNKKPIPVFPSSISQPAEAAANEKPFFVYQYEGFGEPCPAQSTFETLDRKLDGETNIYLHDVFAVPGDREGHLPATLAFDESGNLMEQANNGQDLAIIRVMRENEDL
jgi:hypothetical protein